MTIKLSNTNSVNKTLQHKALLDLQRNVVTAVKRASSASWTPLRPTGICISSGRVQLESGEHNYLSSSVNKLSISRSKKDIILYCEQQLGRLPASRA